MGPLEANRRLRTGVGLLEVEADAGAPTASLRTKVAACWVLLVGIVAAQIADAVTTAVALSRPGTFEWNSLMRGSPGAANRCDRRFHRLIRHRRMRYWTRSTLPPRLQPASWRSLPSVP